MLQQEFGGESWCLGEPPNLLYTFTISGVWTNTCHTVLPFSFPRSVGMVLVLGSTTGTHGLSSFVFSQSAPIVPRWLELESSFGTQARSPPTEREVRFHLRLNQGVFQAWWGWESFHVHHRLCMVVWFCWSCSSSPRRWVYHSTRSDAEPRRSLRSAAAHRRDPSSLRSFGH